MQHSKCTLFILCGHPYSGKSYLARQIVAETDIELISIDSLFESNGFSWDDNKLPDTQEWDVIFNTSYELTAGALQAGKSVLYDSTNHTVASRDKLRAIARANNVECKVIYVKTSTETIWQRWEENNLNPTRSKVSRELVQQTIDAFEEPTESERVIIIEN
ncbi:ATP-binding protein [Patescibacteria group bacterium]|nr:ATP-binding protein [Patescibacteria group bacterium]